MPADVGAGSFWSEGTSLVNGDITAEEAADEHPGDLAVLDAYGLIRPTSLVDVHRIGAPALRCRCPVAFRGT